MSVEVTRLPSGLSVVTDHMPHLETASLGVWVGSGSRDEQPDEHGISHLLEHMAFKGTTRRTARQIAEEIEAVGGDLNAATSVETTAYYARVLKADVPLALDVLSDILSDPTFDPDELHREQNVIVQEIGATEDAPDDLVFDHLQETAFPDQPVGRSILGTPETVRSFNPAKLRDLSGAQLSRARHGGGGRRRGRIIAQIVAEAEKRFASFVGPPAPMPEPAQFGGGTHIEARDLEQVHVALALQGRAGARRAALQPAGLHQRARRRNVVAAVPGSAREARPLLLDLRLPHALLRHRHVRPLRRHRRARRAGIDAGRDRRDRRRDRDYQRGRDRQAKAQMKAGLLMALESSGARAEQMARQMMVFGRPIPLEEIVAKVEAVTVESARAAGRALIHARPAGDRRARARQRP